MGINLVFKLYKIFNLILFVYLLKNVEFIIMEFIVKWNFLGMEKCVKICLVNWYILKLDIFSLLKRGYLFICKFFYEWWIYVISKWFEINFIIIY